MQDHTSKPAAVSFVTDETKQFSRQTARNAANAAAQNFELERNRADRKRPGKIALYTWGLLACFSVGWVFAIGFFPQGSPNTTIVAQNDPNRDVTPDIIAPEIEPKLALKPSLDPSVTELSALDEVEEFDPIKTASFEPPSEDRISTRITSPAQTKKTPNLRLGVSIGASPDARDLMRRYSALSRREPRLFSGLAPRIAKAEGATAQLITGPFTSRQEMAAFCRTLQLRLTVACTQADYAGKQFVAR